MGLTATSGDRGGASGAAGPPLPKLTAAPAGAPGRPSRLRTPIAPATGSGGVPDRIAVACGAGPGAEHQVGDRGLSLGRGVGVHATVERPASTSADFPATRSAPWI